MRLGQVALISAAGAGIGRATAMIMAREGGTIAAVDVEQGLLDRLTADVTAAGGRALPLRADALDAASVEGAVKRVADTYGQIDILVNAVGGSTVVGRPAALLDELTLEEWQKLLHFNLTGTFLFSHAVIPVMKRQRGGKIVNLASIAGRGVSRTSSSAYATAKGGIIALTRKLSLELGPHGITVNAIAPSLTCRSGWPHWESGRRGQAAEIERTPLGRVATPGPGAGRLLPSFVRRRLRHRCHHRRDRRAVAQI
jgi:NAD(P)-dependent dehydrogenase (short-subunit alcohol dehydrogenase family)